MTYLIRPDDGVRVRGLRRAEFEKLVDCGLFNDEPVELLGGELIEVSPQGPAHSWAIARLTTQLAPLVSSGYELRVQLPLAVDDVSLPEPDVAVADPGVPAEHPTTARAVIEIAVTSQRLDLVHKAARYAAAGVPLYVVIDMAANQAVVHTLPGEGGYGRVDQRGPSDGLSILGIDVDLQELLVR